MRPLRHVRSFPSQGPQNSLAEQKDSSSVLLVVWGILIEAPHDIAYYIRVRAWADFFQMTGTFLLTLFVGVETGLVGSVAFSLLLVVQNSTGTKIKILGHVPGEEEWVPVDGESFNQQVQG